MKRQLLILFTILLFNSCATDDIIEDVAEESQELQTKSLIT
jgi:hypothetical protein